MTMLGSGWRLSVLYRAYGGGIGASNVESGVRTVTLAAASTGARNNVAGGDNCFCDIANQRPNLLLPGAVYLDKSGGPNTQYLNPNAFGQPAPGTLGNLGRVTLQLPLNWQFDTGLARMFHIREAQTLEIRAEAFNVLNSFRPGNPATALNSAQFGKIITAQDPRLMQFALKYVF